MEKTCKKPSRSGLNAYFHKNIRKNRISHYMDRYMEICNKKLRRQELASLKNSNDFWSYVDWLINTLSITEKDFIVPNNPKLEKILNIMSYASSYAFSWSEYLILFESGKKLLRDLFTSPSLTSFINLYVIIYTIQITEEYDDFLTKDMMKLIPVILPSEILQKAGILQGDISFLNKSWVWTRIQSTTAKIILVKLATYLENVIVDNGYLDTLTRKIKSIRKTIKNEYMD
jgi:hypothetical protein